MTLAHANLQCLGFKWQLEYRHGAIVMVAYHLQ
jgi:hypothetical protein